MISDDCCIRNATVLLQSGNVESYSSNAQIQKKQEITKEGRRNRSKGGGKGNIKVEPATQKNELSRKISNQEKKGHTVKRGRVRKKEKEWSSVTTAAQPLDYVWWRSEKSSPLSGGACFSFRHRGPRPTPLCHTAPSIQKPKNSDTPYLRRVKPELCEPRTARRLPCVTG